MEIPSIEKASDREREAYQLAALQKMMHYLGEKSAFYKHYFETHQIHFDQIKSLSDLSKIPAISKADLHKNGRDFWCVTPKEIVDYSNTSGTEGNAVTVPMTKNDVDRLAYNEAISLTCAGGSEEDIYQLTTTVDRRFMAGMAYVLGVQKMGAGMVRVGVGLPQLQWQTIQELGTTALIIVPSFLLKIIDFAKKNGIDYKNSTVKKAVLIGEPIRNKDFSLNALGKRIKEQWDIELYSTYASTEMATAFTECEAGKGGHLHPELIIAEILDDQGQPVPEGTPGELTITTLGIEGLPLLRFRTGDICAMHTELCSCGRTTPRLGPIVGRKHQMIKYKGTTCYPPALFDVLDSIPQITLYQVEVFSNDYGNDEVIVRYYTPKSIDQHFLVNQFKATARFTPELQPMEEADLLKLIHPPTSRKPIKFVDRRK